MTASDASTLSLHGGRSRDLRERIRTLAPVSADVWALMGVVLVAVVIRILTIDNQSFWSDESLTVYETSLPFGAMLHTVAQVETTPPLFFVLTWIWAKVFGSGTVALRSISELAGVALVPLAYLSARELFSRWAGVIAAAFVAVNPFLLWYSQEARSYMLLAALSAAGFLWFVRALSLPSWRHLGLWALFSGLALTAHFFAGFIVAPEAVWLLWRHRSRVVLTAAAVVAVVQVAMLPFAINDTNAAHGTDWIAHVPRVHRIVTAGLESAVSILNRRGNALEAGLGWALLVGLLVALVAFSRDRRTRVSAVVVSSIVAFVIVAPIALGYLGQDYFLTRNVIPAFVPLAVLIAGACAAPRSRRVGLALAGVLLIVFVAAGLTVQTAPQLMRPQWRTLAQKLGPAPVPRAVFVAGGTTADPLKIYMPGVTWVQPQRRPVEISEVDIVGGYKRMALVPARPGVLPGLGPSTDGTSAAQPLLRGTGKASPLPVVLAPPGTRLISRRRVRNWVVARFVLTHPRKLSVQQLLGMAHSFFGHTPLALLVFTQEPRA